MTWLVDAHVHYQRCFGWERFLASAAANLDAAAATRPDGEVDAGCLLFVDVEGENSFEKIQSMGQRRDGARPEDRIPDAWTLRSTGESTALALERPQGPPLLLVQGRQIATREGLEVLAIACGEPLADGLSLEATVEEALSAGAIAVIPWGFGKWWFARGEKVIRLLEGDLGSHVHLGDNGNRLAAGPEPRPFEAALRRGLGILPGSDPLPFPHHTRRALSYAFWLSGKLRRDRPGATLRAHVPNLEGLPPTWGSLRNVPAFVVDQVRMQVHARTRRNAAPTGPRSRMGTS